MLTTRIEIAGNTYEVSEMRRKPNRAWRKQFESLIGDVVGPVLEMAADAQNIVLVPDKPEPVAATAEDGQDGEPGAGDQDKAPAKSQAEQATETINTLVGAVGKAFADGGDMALDLLYAYSPEMKAAKDQIDQEARDSEIADAIVKIVLLAYPFGSIRAAVSSLSLGG